MNQRLSVFLLLGFLLQVHAGATTLEEAIKRGFKCRQPHDIETIFDGKCVEQFICEKSGEEPLFHAGSVPLDQNKECPKTVDDFLLRAKAASNQMRTSTVRMEVRKTGANSECQPFPDGLANGGYTALTQYKTGSGMGSYCIVGAVCSALRNALRRQGAVACTPKPNAFDDKLVNGKSYKFPVCRDFDDCLVHSLAAPKDLLTNYLKKNDPQQTVTSNPHVPTVPRSDNGTTAAPSTSVAQSRHVDSVITQ